MIIIEKIDFQSVWHPYIICNINKTHTKSEQMSTFQSGIYTVTISSPNYHGHRLYTLSYGPYRWICNCILQMRVKMTDSEVIMLTSNELYNLIKGHLSGITKYKTMISFPTNMESINNELFATIEITSQFDDNVITKQKFKFDIEFDVKKVMEYYTPTKQILSDQQPSDSQ